MNQTKSFSKKMNYVLSTALLATSLLPATTFAQSRGLKDIDKLPQDQREIVQDMYSKGLISGYGDSSFKPSNSITRAEFASMLVNSLGLTDETSGKTFSDSSEGKDWHYSALNLAYTAGLMSGDGTDKKCQPIMKPNAEITRLEMMLILVRAAEMSGDEISLTNAQVNQILAQYKDRKEVPQWAQTEVAKAVKEGITTGIGDGKLGSSQKGNRVQSAVFSYRAMNKKAENEKKTEQEFQVALTKYFGDVFTYLTDEQNNPYIQGLRSEMESNKINLENIHKQIAADYSKNNPNILSQIKTEITAIQTDVKAKYTSDMETYKSVVGEKKASKLALYSFLHLVVELSYRLAKLDNYADLRDKTQEALLSASPAYQTLYNKYRAQELAESTDAAAKFDFTVKSYQTIETILLID